MHRLTIATRMNIDADIDSPKDRSYLSWPICLLPFFYIIFTMIMGFYIQSMNDPQKNPKYAQATLKTLQYNLGHPLIEDILMTRTCPRGYQIAHLGSWKGVNSGCLCSNGEIKSRTYCLTDFGRNCKSVKYIGVKTFSIWKGRQFCIKYINEWSLGRNCTQGFLQCGNLCVKGLQCPITNLTQHKKDYDSLIIGDQYYKKVRSGDEPLLYFIMNPGNSSNFQCLDSFYQSRFESGKYYPLANQPEKGCDGFGDMEKYTIQLDSHYQLKVYQENDFNTFKTIPYFTDYIAQDDSYSLQVIKRISIAESPQCDQIEPESLHKIRLQGQLIHSYTKYLTKIIIIISLISTGLTSLVYIMKQQSCTAFDFRQFKIIECQIVMTVLIVVACICLGVIYYLQADGKQGIDGLNNVYESFKEINCFADEGFQMVYFNVKKAVDQVIQFSKLSYSDTEPFVKILFYSAIGYVLIITFLLIYQFSLISQFCIKPWN